LSLDLWKLARPPTSPQFQTERHASVAAPGVTDPNQELWTALQTISVDPKVSSDVSLTTSDATWQFGDPARVDIMIRELTATSHIVSDPVDCTKLVWTSVSE